jgi:hypothetical protein
VVESISSRRREQLADVEATPPRSRSYPILLRSNAA